MHQTQLAFCLNLYRTVIGPTGPARQIWAFALLMTRLNLYYILHVERRSQNVVIIIHYIVNNMKFFLFFFFFFFNSMVIPEFLSRKYTYIILIPLKPHFYIVKLGFTKRLIFFPFITKTCLIFLISAQKHTLWYSLEPPRRDGSTEYPQSMFWAEMWKISEFLSENFHILVVKFSVYLNRHVFVMWYPLSAGDIKTEHKVLAGTSV